MPDLPVYHQPPEPTQTHVHHVGDAIQPTHPLSSLLLLPSIFPRMRVFSNKLVPASGGQSIGVSAIASVLPMNNNISSTYLLLLTTCPSCLIFLVVWEKIIGKRIGLFRYKAICILLVNI